MKNLSGKVALVTGAASGIGRAIALGLARQGVHLFLVDIDGLRLSETVTEAAKHGSIVTSCIGDLTKPREISYIVESLLETWSGLDILVNNAGIAFYGPTEQMTDEQWQRLMAVNLHAPVQLTRELLPTLLARQESHVLNVCSIAGLVAQPRLAAYHTSKFALVGFSESLRAEYGPRGLGVTALCPGLVRTNMLQSAETVPGKKIRQPPSWMCTSPERVAEKAIRAIRGNKGLVLVAPMAHLLWGFKRFAPAILDRMQQFRRHSSRPAAVCTPLMFKPQELHALANPAVLACEVVPQEQNEPVILSFSDHLPLRHKRAA